MFLFVKIHLKVFVPRNNKQACIKTINKTENYRSPSCSYLPFCFSNITYVSKKQRKTRSLFRIFGTFL